MSFKRTFPYCLTSAAMLFLGAHSLDSDGKGNTPSTDEVKISMLKNAPQKSALVDSIAVISDTIRNDSVAVKAIANRYDVVYTRADGNQFRRSGGTRAWRNNNPGCLRYSEFTVTQGAIGQAGGFAVFPDKDTGLQAICALLKSDKYKDLTISQAIFTYAPPHENDTESYNANLRKITGLSIDTKLSTLNDEQIKRVANAISTVEGWRSGTETMVNTKPVDSTKFYANARNVLLQQAKQHTI